MSDAQRLTFERPLVLRDDGLWSRPDDSDEYELVSPEEFVGVLKKDYDALVARVAELEAQLQAWRDLCVRKKFDTCGLCGRSKKPFGRDAPPSSNYCSHGCGGYLRDPYPSQLWPGECYDSRGMPAQPPQQETP